MRDIDVAFAVEFYDLMMIKSVQRHELFMSAFTAIYKRILLRMNMTKKGKNILMSRTSIVIALMCVCVALFTSCSSYHKFSYENGLYVDEKTGCEYYCAPIYYEPVNIGDRYGNYKSAKDGVVYEIDGLEPSVWLCDDVDGIKSVFYSTDVELPTFKDFSPDSFSIFISDADRKFSSCSESDVVDSIAELLECGENVEIPFDNTAIYYLKFESQKFPGLYYNIMAIHERDLGKIFIYDRGSRKTVDSGSILYGMLPYTDSLKERSN